MAKNRWIAAAVFLLSIDMGANAQPAVADLNLPEAPSPLVQQASPATGAQSTTPPAPPALTPEEEERKTSQEQLKQQEQQRVMGVMATFNTTANKDALPLSRGEKYQLFFKSATDPWPFLLAGFSSGIDQAENSFPEYHQGWKGYAKRYGASYTDYFTGNLLGNAVLADLLKEDPRYYQKGTGRVAGRIGWAATSSVWCKRDSGTWGPNYANVIGNLMGAAVSNLYYPESNRTASGTIERGLSVTAEAIVGSEVIEFWPDFVRHHRRKQAEKMARQMGTTSAPARPPVSPAP